MPYLDLGGIAAYYEQHGSGDPVVLLHGGFCSLETMRAQSDHLAASYRVHAMERPGHGRTPDRPGPISFEHMVADTVAYFDAVGLDSAHVVGFSDGAVTGLLLALRQPERLRSLVAISANLDPSVFPDDDAEPGGADTGAATAEEPDPEREAYDRLSPDGPAHGDVVLEKLVTMWRSEPQIDPDDLAVVTTPTLIMAGDRDVIPTQHTIDIAAAIPNAQLRILTDAGHLAVREQADVVNGAISAFLSTLPAHRKEER